ncbi:hypothetical protein B0T25DRAFT_535743 [Lasiosphaeria hispida]|uniref:Phytocyanin domain-containing protein n=1 Tax=Lasiosphaeria hispida TaxID=260671 RepID=A0AAJ0MIN0_9PEZI|nr:hypothetical protein B0T25DRAFT_535743 [Lasiosphaeria hispida]
MINARLQRSTTDLLPFHIAQFINSIESLNTKASTITKPTNSTTPIQTAIMQLTLLLSLLPLASAGYSYGAETTAASPSPSTAAQQQTVAGVTRINVGQNGLTMEPKDVTVPAGETIEFHFFTGSHSVAQSAFDSPCTPLAVNGTEGFFSGAQAVSSGEGANVFRVVSTGSPMWYYCATGRHCQGGMVGVINKP